MRRPAGEDRGGAGRRDAASSRSYLPSSGARLTTLPRPWGSQATRSSPDQQRRLAPSQDGDPC